MHWVIYGCYGVWRFGRMNHRVTIAAVWVAVVVVLVWCVWLLMRFGD